MTCAAVTNHRNSRISIDTAKLINVYYFTMNNLNSGFKWLQKAICLAMICTFGVGLSAADALALGDCGLKCCCQSKPLAQHHVAQRHAPPEQIRSAMGCCAGSAQMPCDLVPANALRYPDITIASATGHATTTVGTANGPSIALIDRYDLGGHVFRQFKRVKFRPPPLYLQNLSFLI